MASPGATAYRVVLGTILRSYRERAGITPKQVVEAVGFYGPGKVSKMEAGTVRLDEDELEGLLSLYAISGEEADKLREFGIQARERTGPERTPAWGETYKVLEAQAAEIKFYGEAVLPGLVQTEDYARAVLSTSLITPPAEVDQRAQERVARQGLLTSADPPEFWIVLAEPILLRPVGGPAVLRAQLQRLRELTELPNVTLQVIPLDRGEYVALNTPFMLLHLAMPTFTFAYLEGLTDANYLDHPDATKVYRLAFDRLRVTALDDLASVKLLDRRIKEIK